MPSPSFSASPEDSLVSSLNQDCTHVSSALASSPDTFRQLPFETPVACSCGLKHLHGTLCFDSGKTDETSKPNKGEADGNSTSNAHNSVDCCSRCSKAKEGSCCGIFTTDSLKDQEFVSAFSENADLNSDATKQKSVPNSKDITGTSGKAESFLPDLGSLIRESMFVVDNLDSIGSTSGISALNWDTSHGVKQMDHVNVENFSEDTYEPLQMPQKPRMVCWGNQNGRGFNRNSFQYDESKNKNDMNNNSTLVNPLSMKNKIVSTPLASNRKHSMINGAFSRRPYLSRMVHPKRKKIEVTKHALALRHVNALKSKNQDKLAAASLDKVQHEGETPSSKPNADSSSLSLPHETLASSNADSAVPKLFSAFNSFIQSVRSPETLNCNVGAGTAAVTNEAWKKVLAQAQQKLK